MLKMVHGRVDVSGAAVPMGQAEWPAPFAAELEYNSPAHGPWNIVHMGMLIPGAHQIYVCAPNCNRGVVLTAAEMNAIERFSTVFLREENFVDGDMEDVIIEGVTDIVNKLPRKPSCILLFTVCAHHFLGTDIPMVYRVLRNRFPDLPFVECYMDPIKQKTDRSPDQYLRKAMYTLLEERPRTDKSISIIGGDFPLDDSCDLLELAHSAGRTVKELPRCETFEEFLTLSESDLLVYTYPNARLGTEELSRRLGTSALYLPSCFGYAENEQHLRRLAEKIGVSAPDCAEKIQRCEEALAHAKAAVGDAPVVLDYTFHPRALGLARLLLEHGFNVTKVYLDAFNGEERGDYDWLCANAPELMVYATNQVKMREMPRENSTKTLAIGQKAAYFNATDYFVNMVQGGGLWGFDGIVRTAELMVEAFETPKDGKALIPRKGLGCACAL